MHRSIASVMLLASLAACSSSQPAVPRIDFIPRDISLTPSADNANLQTFRAAGLEIQRFAKAMVLTTELRVQLDDHKRSQELPAEMKSNLEQFIGLPRALDDSASTLVVHSAITGARPDNPLVDLGTHQPSRGDGGYTAVEVFATDGMKGPVVAAMTYTIISHKLTLGSNAAWARTETALQEAAEAFAKLLKPGLTFPQDR